jgi:hypothetical protein
MAARSTQDTPRRTAGRVQATQTRQSRPDDEDSRLAQNLPSDRTVPEQVYSDYAQNYDEEDAAHNASIPDVLVDAPVVSLKGLDFELDELRAHISLFSKVLELVELSVGVDAYLGRVKLTIESVDVQALVKVRLDNVTAILDRVLTTIDRNPQIIQELTRRVGSAVENAGQGASDALSDVGSGAGSAVEDVGEGAGEAVEDVGGGAGQAVDEVGQGAGQAAQAVGEGAGRAAGRTIEGTASPGTQPLSDTVGEADRTVRRVVDESGSIVEQTLSESGEVLEEAVVGQANATGEAGEVQATPAAKRKAEELGVDLSQVEGTGAGGRITIKDVQRAARQG